VDPTVYDTTLKANALFEHGTLEKDFRQAMAMFQSALDRDPSYAPAWAGLASATWSLAEAGLEFVAPSEVRDKAIAAVDKALGLDPDLPEAHEARAFIAMEGEWNLARAKEEFEKALELRPSYAKCHSELGTLLLFLNDFSGAQGHLKMAEELDPFSPYVAFNRILVFNETGHPEQGLAAGKHMLQADPGNWLIPAEMGYSHLALERYAEAAEDFERCLKVGERSGATLGKLGYAYARAGRRQEAQKILAEFERARRTVFVPPHRTAWILIGLGRKEEAIQDLESAFQLRVGSLIWIAPRPMEWRIFLGGMEDVRLTQLRRRIVQAIQFPGGKSPWDEP
jgi:tetratricopeptide (TPR) repeat protein